MKEEYTIGKLAKESGVTVETVRFYEQKGLIKQPSSKSGYRKYPYDDIIKIKFIKSTQELGFTLNEAKELLELRVKSNAKCGQVKIKAESKLKEVSCTRLCFHSIVYALGLPSSHNSAILPRELEPYNPKNYVA